MPGVIREDVELSLNRTAKTTYAEACAAGERLRNERLSRLGQSDMELIFLGTASCVPSTTRGVSCTALRYQGRTWVFDAGEGSQVQVQRSPHVHPGRVDCIFVTHVHGDHTFGLPGLLCIIGQNKGDENDASPIEIFGPEGLRFYLRAALQLTQSRVAARYRVHELKKVPCLQRSAAKLARVRSSIDRCLPIDPNFGELPGTDVYPDEETGLWHLNTPGDLEVSAAAMVHTVPCVGYVVREPHRPGKLDVEKVADVLERNYDALKAKGVKQPKKVYKLIKEMDHDQVFTFPDGTKIKAADCVSAPTPGRVIAICGDTANAGLLKPLLKDRCDVLVHEATNAYLGEPYDPKLDADAVRAATAAHGHSTPEMAAAFALAVHARRLVLTHFSPRYKGDAVPVSLDVMRKIEDIALHTLKKDRLCDDDPVIAAWDLAMLPVHPPPAEANQDARPAHRKRTPR